MITEVKRQEGKFGDGTIIELHTLTMQCVGVEIHWLIAAIKQASRPRASFSSEARTYLAGVAGSLEAAVNQNLERKGT